MVMCYICTKWHQLQNNMPVLMLSNSRLHFTFSQHQKIQRAQVPGCTIPAISNNNAKAKIRMSNGEIKEWRHKAEDANISTPWAIKRSQFIFVCNFVKNQRILMQFSLSDFTIWRYKLHPLHLINVATLHCKSQNAEKACEHNFSI